MSHLIWASRTLVYPTPQTTLHYRYLQRFNKALLKFPKLYLDWNSLLAFLFLHRHTYTICPRSLYCAWGALLCGEDVSFFFSCNAFYGNCFHTPKLQRWINIAFLSERSPPHQCSRGVNNCSPLFVAIKARLHIFPLECISEAQRLVLA